MDVLKITASDAYLTRLPEFIASANGYFADADLTIETHLANPWNAVTSELKSGEWHIAADGMWLPSLYKHRAGDFYAFAKSADRFPMAIVAREKMDNFTFKALEGKIVLIPGSFEAGTRVYTLGSAQEGGADISAIKYVPNFYVPMLYETFAGGWGDFVVMRTDFARQLEAAGKGYIVYDFVSQGGAVPWFTYYSTKQFLDASTGLAARFTAALAKAYAWLQQNNGEACRPVLNECFPSIPTDEAVKIVDHYRQAGMWEGTVALGEAEVARWEGFMHQAHLLDKPLPYGEIVDSRPFAQAGV
ncbi:MAG: ABC transporter substrate-binding protein [Planctomycetes bacterium]|nr:ABC transporter substrate-binding protein [Planctomycetota bacterium]